MDKPPSPFARPFAAFPHDYAAVRVVVSTVLDRSHRSQGLLRGESESCRQAKFEAWKNEATQRYELVAARGPIDKVGQSHSDEIWHWMEGMVPVLGPGWGELVAECANVSLGLQSDAAAALPADLVAACATWEARKAEGSLQEIWTLHAPCPNHMFGPPSFVQGYVEEYLEEWVLLVELSTRRQIGLEFGEGVLQFMIRPSALREGRFDRAKLIASAY